jgi:putative oxidoreductase
MSDSASTNHWLQRFRAGTRRAGAMLDRLAPFGDLLLRLWVANVFFKSALTKIASFESTIALFTHEYQVPLLPPAVAAWLGTGVELVFPVLLAAGLTGRLSAFVLFVFNIVAAISYPDLSDAGVRDHQLWGLMLLVLTLRGPGALSLDALIAHWLKRRA